MLTCYVRVHVLTCYVRVHVLTCYVRVHVLTCYGRVHEDANIFFRNRFHKTGVRKGLAMSGGTMTMSTSLFPSIDRVRKIQRRARKPS